MRYARVLVGILALAAVACDSGEDTGTNGSSSGKIAFASDRDGNYEIYFMNADGTGQTRLTRNSADDYDPVWSPR
jgi:Tol biopolymer transport system component